MPLGFHRRAAVVDSAVPYTEFNRQENGLIANWAVQVVSGLVAPCFSPALALGRELLVKDFTAGLWAASSGVTINDSDTFTSTGAGGVRVNDPSIAPGKTYPMRIKGTTTATEIKIRPSDGSATYKTIVGSGAFDETFTIAATSDGIFIRNSNAGTTDIDWANTTIKQTDIAASSAFPGAELLNESGAHGTATAANYQALNNAILTNPSSGVLRVTRSGSNNATARQNILIAGQREIFEGEFRGDGTFAARVLSGGAVIVATSTISTTWQPFSVELVNITNARYELRSLATSAGFAEFRNMLVKPANPMRGDISGLSLGIPSGTLLGYLVSSDGINDNLSIDSAELNSFINFDNLSFDMWAIADTWAAGTDYLFNFGIDSNNYFRGYRTGTNLIIEHKAGGVQKSITKASGSPSGLFHFGGSIDVGNDIITLLYNGLPGGTATSLGTMVGNLSSDETVIGAFDDSGANSWAGDWTQATLFNITLTDGDWIRRFEAGGV